jgi:hypothetical protein
MKSTCDGLINFVLLYENVFSKFEKKVIRIIYGPYKDVNMGQ